MNKLREYLDVIASVLALACLPVAASAYANDAASPEKTEVLITAFNQTDVKPRAYTLIFSKYEENSDGTVTSYTTIEATGREVQVLSDGFLAYDFSLPTGTYYISAFKAYFDDGVRTEYPISKTVSFEVGGGNAVYLGHYTVEQNMALSFHPAISKNILENFGNVNHDLKFEIKLNRGTPVAIKCILDGYKITNSCRNVIMSPADSTVD